jgi:molybdopterin/thiamine biosynthesis adenylyltransferase
MGVKGQLALAAAKVLVIGAGGLGSPNIMYLAGAGVGTLGIVDGDVVDISNLHRQIAHDDTSVGQSKAWSASTTARDINSNIKVVTHDEWFTADNAAELISQYDFVIDAVDNFAIKYLINDACVIEKKPFCHAGVVGWKGQVFVHDIGGVCLRCIVPEPTPRELAPTCSRSGILGPMAGIIACMQATEVLKYLIGVSTLTHKMVMFDGKKMKMNTLTIEKRMDCQVCGQDPTITDIQTVEMPVCDLKG